MTRQVTGFTTAAPPVDGPAPPASARSQSTARPFLAFVVCITFLVPTNGCVSRRMLVQTDPPGALLMVDGKEVGYTPIGVDFTYYGTREVTLMKDGYETLTVMQKVRAPWYQYPGIDFFSDNLLPGRVTDRQQFAYQMQPKATVPNQNLLGRGQQLRSEAQIGR